MSDAIYKLYSQVIRTVGEIAYDANDNVVSYDDETVKTKYPKGVS
jgi:hypothetical protein